MATPWTLVCTTRAPSPVLAEAEVASRGGPSPGCSRSRRAGRLLQVDVLCGAGVLQMLLVVLQEGAASGGERPQARGPTAPPGPATPPQLHHSASWPGPAEGCLFTLLIVSFDVQKLLRLIRPHLFIFAFISTRSLQSWERRVRPRLVRGREPRCQNI